ncbi:MAG: DUF1572 family protein, partial [Acidobacteriota bacterium]
SELDYLPVTRREHERLKQIAERAMAQLDDAHFFHTLDADENSVAILVKHVAGNMLSRWRDFLTCDGEKPDRNRDGEFEIGEANSRDQLMNFWQAGWACLFSALDPLEDDDLGRIVKIRGEPHSVLQAISRQLSHYAYHVGQIVFLSKHLLGSDWQTLSIAKGESETFNAEPERYLQLSSDSE